MPVIDGADAAAGNAPAASFAPFARLRFWRLLPVLVAGVVAFVLVGRYLPGAQPLLQAVGAGGGMLGAYALLFLAAWYACHAAGLTLRDVFGPRVRDVRALERPAWVALPLLGFAATIAAATLYLLRALLGDVIDRMVQDREAMGAVAGLSRALVIVVVSLAAPLVEEFVFRGMLLRRLAATRGAWFAIVASALCFGILHPLMPVGAAALGVVYGIVLVATNALWLTVFMHAVHNTIIAVLAFGPGDRQAAAPSLEPALQPGAGTIVMMLLAAAALGTVVWRLIAPYRAALPGHRAGSPSAVAPPADE